MLKPTCAVDGCEKPRRKRDWCNTHYERWRVYGDVFAHVPVTGQTLNRVTLILSSFEADDDGCWRWNRHISRYGYGTLGGKRAHRLVYELLVGPIPEGLHLDHLCRVRCCVNPTHLEPVTNAENMRRGLIGELKTHCANGHPWVAENLIPNRPRAGWKCRICDAERRRRARAADRCWPPLTEDDPAPAPRCVP